MASKQPRRSDLTSCCQTKCSLFELFWAFFEILQNKEGNRQFITIRVVSFAAGKILQKPLENKSDPDSPILSVPSTSVLRDRDHITLSGHYIMYKWHASARPPSLPPSAILQGRDMFGLDRAPPFDVWYSKARLLGPLMQGHHLLPARWSINAVSSPSSPRKTLSIVALQLMNLT